MIGKCCKECPWVVKTNNNKIITQFSKKHNKRHNCHMVPRDKSGGMWDVKEECMCYGSRQNIKINNEGY